jgi:hypothetical protein
MLKKQKGFHCKEYRGMIKYLFLRQNLAKKKLCRLHWVIRVFPTPHSRTRLLHSEQDIWALKTNILEDTEVMHSMMLDNWRICTQRIAETLEKSKERIGYIIQIVLHMRQLSATWVPQPSEWWKKCDQVIASQVILDQFWWEPVQLLNHLITTYQTPISACARTHTHIHTYIYIYIYIYIYVIWMDTRWFFMSKKSSRHRSHQAK